MFTAAAGAIVEQMKSMREGIGAALDKQMVQASLSSLRTSYAPLWDGAPRETSRHVDCACPRSHPAA